MESECMKLKVIKNIWCYGSKMYIFYNSKNWLIYNNNNTQLVTCHMSIHAESWIWRNWISGADRTASQARSQGGHFGAVPPRWSGVPPRWMFPPECLPLSAPPLNSPRWVPPRWVPPRWMPSAERPLAADRPTTPLEFLKLRRLPPTPPRIRKTSPTTPLSNS